MLGKNCQNQSACAMIFTPIFLQASRAYRILKLKLYLKRFVYQCFRKYLWSKDKKHLFSLERLNKHDKALILSFYFKSEIHGALGKEVFLQQSDFLSSTTYWFCPNNIIREVALWKGQSMVIATFSVFWLFTWLKYGINSRFQQHSWSAHILM